MFNVLNASLPRYFLAQHAGERELGLFAAFVALLGSLYLVQTALGQAALPRLSQHYARGDRASFLRIGLGVVAWGTANGALAVAIAWWWGRPLLELAYSADCAAQWPSLVWLAITSAVQCVAYAVLYLLSSTRHFRQVAAVTLANFASTLCGCAWLIPTFGLRGAAWAMLASALLCLLLSLGLLLRGLALLRTASQ
jgi:O-antigen/teichoic acid export membrane protein